MLLINELNRLYQESPRLVLQGWNEKQHKAFSVELDIRDKTIERVVGLEENVFAQLLWRSGIYPVDHGARYADLERYLKQKTLQPRGIAIDTNIILSRFLRNFLKQKFQAIQDQLRAIVVVPQASSHEFHYKAGFSWSKDGTSLQKFLKFIKSKPELSKLITDSTTADTIKSRLRRVKSFAGRLGIKGQLELRGLQQEFPVILVKSPHFYYSSVVKLDQNVDAIFDSLIRIEIDQINTFTNMELLFLTADKDQHEAAVTEGIHCRYIKPPVKWTELAENARLNISLENIAQLIFELLFFSPYLTLKTEAVEAYYAFFWYNKQSGENLQTKIKKVLADGTVEFLQMH